MVTKICKCGTRFMVFQSAINRGGGKYCCLECYHEYKKLVSYWKGKNMSKEMKQKMSKSHIKKHKQKEYGFKKGELTGDKNPAKRLEVRKKISEKLKGHIVTEETRKNIKKGQQTIIHHINGDHSDNRPENKMIMTQSEHFKLHIKQGDLKRW